MIYTSLHEADMDKPYTDYTGGEAMPAAKAGLSGFLLWLRLWMYHVADAMLTDLEERHYSRYFHYGLSARQVSLVYGRWETLLPKQHRAATEPLIMLTRSTRRMVRRGLPPSRRYAGLHHLNARQLNLGQYLERACRLSANGRIVVYRLESRKRLCQRRDEVCRIGGSLGWISSQPIALLKPP